MCDDCWVSTNTPKRAEGKMTPWRFESGGFGRKIVRLFFLFFFSLWLAFHPNISEDANRQTDKKAKRYADALVDPKKKCFLRVLSSPLTVSPYYVQSSKEQGRSNKALGAFSLSLTFHAHFSLQTARQSWTQAMPWVSPLCITLYLHASKCLLAVVKHVALMCPSAWGGKTDIYSSFQR